MMRPRLVTIPISHYCEKVRWALQRARIPFDEERHLQIFHYARVLPMAGSITVPVLESDTSLLRDSTEILRWVDAQVAPEQRLFPHGELGERAAEWEARFDEELGPAVRRITYDAWLPRRDLVEKYNGSGVPAWQLRVGMAMFPLAALYLKQRMNVTASNAASDVQKIDALFERVSQHLADGRRYLLGDRFTAADLAFAALGAFAVVPPEYGIPLPSPEELPASFRAHVLRWRSTPAGAHILRLYREDRGPARSA